MISNPVHDRTNAPHMATFHRTRLSFLLSGMVLLAGCATLPKSGPTGAQIRKDLVTPAQAGGISIVEVDTAAVLPAPLPPASSPFADGAPLPTDVVGPGDVLEIGVYEAGVTLFGGSGDKAAAAQPGFDPAVKAERLPPLRVDDSGSITLPYAGRLHVAGLKPDDIAALIKHALRGFSEDPQIIVGINQTITNSVIVGGEVSHPGRLVLQTNRETLTDALALAGGYRGEVKDLTIRLTRQGNGAEYRLSDLVGGQTRDLLVRPGDRIQVLNRPHSYSVMGAAGKVALLPFASADLTLAEAISQAGGADPRLGDAEAIFVFRMEPDAAGIIKPTVYHFNLMHPSGFFLARQFRIRDKDVLYFGNARANQTDKLLMLVSELFTPLITAISAAQVIRN
jgi:polysaccharide export outer membrane protein